MNKTCPNCGSTMPVQDHCSRCPHTEHPDQPYCGCPTCSCGAKNASQEQQVVQQPDLLTILPSFLDEFVEQAVRTEAPTTVELLDRLSHSVRLLHAGMGVATEGGEFLDGLKKHIFYGKVLDRVNLKEELGDTLWYIALACHELNISLYDVMATVIGKLRLRYPNKFVEYDALQRDLGKERLWLESTAKKE